MANPVCEVLVTDVQLNAPENCVDPTVGARVDFQGIVRASEDGREIEGIDYEAHREMAANLTEDQRLKRQEIESRRRHWHGFHDSRPAPSASPESSAWPP